MANILDKIAQIRQAVFGKDVRENIAKGIEAINQEVESTTERQEDLEATFENLVINAGSSNAEIVAARYDNVNNKNHATVGERLDAFASDMADKAYKLDTLSGEISYATYKPLVTIIADDGLKENYTILRQLAIEKDFKFCACVYVQPVEQNQPYMMTLNEMLTLQNEGHEIMSHGYVKDAQITLLSKLDWDKELGYSREYLKSKGLEADNFVYQGGAYNNDVMNYVRNYYNSAWAINEKINDEPFNNYKATRFAFDNLGTLATMKTRVDNIFTAGKGWLVLMIHPHYPIWQDEAKKQEMRDFIDYVKSKNIDIVTVKEGLKIYGNAFDMGGGITEGGGLQPNFLKVTKQGKLLGSFNRSFSQIRNTVMPSTLPSYFDSNSTNITYHDSQTSATGFPTSNMGILITKKGLNELAIQEWHPYKTTTPSEFFYRRRSLDTASWGDWIKLRYVPVSQEEINGADPNLSTYPSSSPGQLTKSSVVGVGYYTEEYDLYNKNRKFKRYKKSDGNMSDWIEYCFKKNKDYSLVTPTLNASSLGTKTLDVTDLALTDKDTVIVNFSTLPAGIIWSYTVNTTSIIFNFYNTTGASITGQTVYPKVTVIIGN